MLGGLLLRLVRVSHILSCWRLRGLQLHFCWLLFSLFPRILNDQPWPSSKWLLISIDSYWKNHQGTAKYVGNIQSLSYFPDFGCPQPPFPVSSAQMLGRPRNRPSSHWTKRGTCSTVFTRPISRFVVSWRLYWVHPHWAKQIFRHFRKKTLTLAETIHYIPKVPLCMHTLLWTFCSHASALVKISKHPLSAIDQTQRFLETTQLGSAINWIWHEYGANRLWTPPASLNQWPAAAQGQGDS